MSTSAPGRSPRGEGRGSTLIPLGIVVLGLVELGGLVLLGHYTSLWWVLGVILIGWVIGLALLVAAGQQSFTRLRSVVRAVRGRGDVAEHMSRPAFTLLAAACFFFPGLLTDVAGLVLLVVPVQRRVARSVGLSAPADGRHVLFRKPGGIIEGEVVVEAQRTGTERSGSTAHPVITQE